METTRWTRLDGSINAGEPALVIWPQVMRYLRARSGFQCLKSLMRLPARARSLRPWTRRQVRVADSWPARRDQPVSVALSPAGDRLALSVGQRLSVSDIDRRLPRRAAAPAACALAPGLTWSPGGDKLAFRDDDGQGRVVDLPRPISAARSARPGCRPSGRRARWPSSPTATGWRCWRRRSPGRMTLRLIGPDREVIWEQAADQEPDVRLSPGRGQPGVVARRGPAGLHHGDVGGLGVRRRHRAAGAAVRRSCADRHRSRLDRRRVGSSRPPRTRRCGSGARTTRCPRPSWRPSRRRGWYSCASGAPR